MSWRNETVTPEPGQYSPAKILGIWLLASAPMAFFGWLAYPLLAPDAELDPFGAAVTRIAVLTVGLAWLFVLSMMIVHQEEGELRWATIKRRLWLNAPRNPKTGEPRLRLLLWAVPLVATAAAWDLILTSSVDRVWVAVFPFLAEPQGYSMAAVFDSPATLDHLRGAWWFLVLFVVQAAFNTMLGEEFLFRGVLLPRLEGVFGRWSWLASGILHGLYHMHQPWSIAANVVSCTLLYALPSWYFRSIWFGIIVHSAQSVFFAFLVLGVVWGKA